MTYFCAMAPHHVPAGEVGLAVIETVEARQAATDWISPRQPALTTFAVCGHLDRASMAEAVAEVRAILAETHGASAYGLRLLLVHLQGLCETYGIDHDQDESYWCWCQPYIVPAPARAVA